MQSEAAKRILGLDLGVGSLGWAILELEDRDSPTIIDAGVRVFEAGVDGSEDAIATGKDTSRAANRREKRQPRRNNDRRARRMRKVFYVLQNHDLLPPCDVRDVQQRHERLIALDKQLRESYQSDCGRRESHLLPYVLRAKALDVVLEPYALGRAFYHLAQRRGFLSNRKTKNSVCQLYHEYGEDQFGA